MSNVLVPIAVCMVLPIAIVLIVALTKMNGDNKRTQIIIKAIEANNNVDADKLVESLKKTNNTPHEVLSLRLLRGCIFSLVGLGLIIVGLFNLINGWPRCRGVIPGSPIFCPGERRRRTFPGLGGVVRLACSRMSRRGR